MIENVNNDLDQNKKIREVWLSYLTWFVSAAVIATFASLFAYYSNNVLPFSALQIRLIQIFSVVVEAASLRQCGYNTQPLDEVTPSEKLNGILFTVFSSIGFFLVVYSFQLDPPA